MPTLTSFQSAGYSQVRAQNDFEIETVYEQWLSTLTTDGKIAVKDMQEYFDLAYSQKQISAPINVAAVTDYSLIDQVLAGK